MKNIFTAHPRSVNETYLQHFRCSMIFAYTMIIGGIAFLIHAIFPFLFEKTGSDYLLKGVCKYVNRLPTQDERVVGLSALLEKKLCNEKE